MGRLSGISLGIITAIGGFVDMGELVTASQAGAQYRFALLWTVTVGVLGIIVFTDMAGRVAIASGRSMFDVIRDRLGCRLAMVSLSVAMLVNILTVVIEICGMALVIQILSHLSYLWWVPLTALFIAAVLWFSSFSLVENGASLMGLAILVFVVAAIKLAPPWGEVTKEMIIPSIPTQGSPGNQLAAFGFAAVALLGAYITPYEIFFYSSGAIEEGWEGKDFITNRATSIVGFCFGSLIVISMMVVSAQTFFSHGLQSQSFSDIPIPIDSSLGAIGLVFFIIGAFAVTGGAALESTLSTAYTACQFFGWDWGKNHKPKDAPMFAFWYLFAILAGAVIAFTGIDPIKLTIYTTALAAFSLPFTFIPLFIIANDEVYMGEQRNGRLVNIASVFFLIVLCIVTVGTVPLFILSGGGG